MDEATDRPAPKPTGAVYLRKSRALNDPDDPELLAHHRTLLLRLAEQDGVPIPPENILEEIVSGETIEKRPLFRQELARWEAGQARASVLYVVEISRLSRGSLAQAARIMEALRKARVRIRTPHRWYDLNAGDDNFTYGLLALLSHRENEIYKERVEIKRAEQVRTAVLRTGRAPWGYLWDRNIPGRRGRLLPHPERFPILQSICRAVLTESVERLALRHGIPSATLQYTLHNPGICGWPARRWVMALTPGGRPRTRPLPREQWVWPEQPGDYPAACTRAEWEAIQAVIDARWNRREKTGFDENGWAKDVLTFTQCPGRVRLAAVGRGRPLYGRVDPETGHLWYIRREPVHAFVRAAIERVMREPAALLAAFRTYRERDEGPGPDAMGLREELRRSRAALDRLTEERAGLADPEARAANLRVQDRLLGEVKRQGAALAKAQEEQQSGFEPDGLAAALLAHPEGFPAVWEQLTGAEKRALANALIAAVPVTVTPIRGRQRYERRLGPVVYRPWVPDVGESEI